MLKKVKSGQILLIPLWCSELYSCINRIWPVCIIATYKNNNKIYFRWSFKMLLQYIGFAFLFQMSFVEFRLHSSIYFEYKHNYVSHYKLQPLSGLVPFLFYSVQANYWLQYTVSVLYEEFCMQRGELKLERQNKKRQFQIAFKNKGDVERR